MNIWSFCNINRGPQFWRKDSDNDAYWKISKINSEVICPSCVTFFLVKSLRQITFDSLRMVTFNRKHFFSNYVPITCYQSEICILKFSEDLIPFYCSSTLYSFNSTQQSANKPWGPNSEASFQQWWEILDHTVQPFNNNTRSDTFLAKPEVITDEKRNSCFGWQLYEEKKFYQRRLKMWDYQIHFNSTPKCLLLDDLLK